MPRPVSPEMALRHLFLERVGWVTTIEEARIKAAMLSSGERYVLRVIDGDISPDPEQARGYVDAEYVAAIEALAALQRGEEVP